jgi:hypothetical protein
MKDRRENKEEKEEVYSYCMILRKGKGTGNSKREK